MVGEDIASTIMGVIKGVLYFGWNFLKSLFFYPMAAWDWLPGWVHWIVGFLCWLFVFWLAYWIYRNRDEWRKIAG